jgi:hypothetical protein
MADKLQGASLDFQNVARLKNVPQSVANGQPVVHEQLLGAIQGLSWKDNVRSASTANVTVSAPGATIDGVTMATSDRFLLKNQTAQTENGIYIWNGAASPATRALDADTFDEMESAVATVDEGTVNAGTRWRQTQVNGVIGTNNVVWASDAAAAAASETVSGVAEIATQAETDTGTDDARIVTPLKLATYANRAKRFSTNIGDGSATSIAVTHNLNTDDVHVSVYSTSGVKARVDCDIQRTSVNAVTLVFDAGLAPAAASLRVVVTN